MVGLTRDVIEREVADTVTRYHRDQQGVSPREVTVYVVDDMVIAKTSGVFTHTEERLVQTSEGRKLVKSARYDQRSACRRDIEALIARIVGCPIERSFWDLDIRSGDQVEVYVLSQPIGHRASAL